MTGLPAETVEEAYGVAGRAAGEAVLRDGRDGARLRPANDAYLLSRIARAAVDALLKAGLLCSGGSGEAPAGLTREQSERLVRAGEDALHQWRDPHGEDGHHQHGFELSLNEARSALRGPVGGEAGQEGGTADG